ncbi:HAUS augmin-like complex subunit 1 [Manacus vitellinus]|uniref:HAUS augmin-like complex subunit 1 n=1 Tax=Manacus vitellinus TaxID=328815 RepID=UPI00115F5C82|nr:HAUS augmin-like complex subunit 1 [Manacus vitellinus]
MHRTMTAHDKFPHKVRNSSPKQRNNNKRSTPTKTEYACTPGPWTPHQLEPGLVSSWLKKIYGDHFIPSDEVNEKTVDILHDLMECCEAKERDVSLLIEDMKHQEAVHEAATKEMQDIFEDLGLSPTSLSRKASRDLSSLAKSAVILQTKDTSLTSLFCAINNMTSEQFETTQKNREMQQKLDDVKNKLTSALMLSKQLLEHIENTEELQKKQSVKVERQLKTMTYLTDKCLELEIRIKDAQRELAARGLHTSLTHKALVQLSEELVSLEKKVASLKKEQKIYLELPFSISLAKVMVEAAKLELKALEDKLSKELDSVAFELM